MQLGAPARKPQPSLALFQQGSKSRRSGKLYNPKGIGYKIDKQSEANKEGGKGKQKKGRTGQRPMYGNWHERGNSRGRPQAKQNKTKQEQNETSN